MLYILIGVLVLLGVLAVPLRVEFQLSWAEGLRGRFVIDWAGGSLRKVIDHQPSSHDQLSPLLQPVERRVSADHFPRLLFRSAVLRSRLRQFVVELIRCVEWQPCSVSVRFGMDDPAETGQLYGVLSSLAIWLARIPALRVAILPDFTQPVWQWRAVGAVRVVPLKLVIVVLRLLFSASIWREVIPSWQRGRQSPRARPSLSGRD